jgi:hypothetical protein
VAGQHAAHLELAVQEPDGRWVDPYPLLVGLADPNELGVDTRTGAGIDPDGLRPSPAAAATTAPVAAPAPAAPWAAPVPLAPEVVPEATPAPPAEPPTTEPPAAEPPAAEPPAAVSPASTGPPKSRVTADILAAMIAPTPAPPAEPVDE